MSENQLAKLASPYLAQHKDNPVHWRPWSDEIFKEAQEKNQPILLSIGYAACHWCHVMAHESFEDQGTADVMNAHFVNVKVDREEHPDVDAIYQKALTILGQHGGWPLTMFLTPKGQPFWGGTYFPKKAAHNRPSFVEVLRTISDIYLSQPENVLKNVEAITLALQEETTPKGNGSLNTAALSEAVGFIHQSFDSTHGGLRGAPKFPQPVLMDFLWRTAWLKKDQQLTDLIVLSLKKMCLGGIYDHIGGGFARYSTDEEWLAPHFEKMLYDNGLLVSLLTTVWRMNPTLLFERTVAQTIDWALREMTIDTESGPAFTSAYDADSEGVEGKFYVWSEAEIDQILGPDSEIFKQAYDVSARGNWEGKNILRRVTDIQSDDQEDALKAMGQKLFDHRKGRIWPGRDDKVLSDWNALMITGMAEAGLAFNRADWIKKGEEIFTSLLNLMSKDGVFYHSYCDGEWTTPAYLDDYANLSRAALALYEATGKTLYLDQVKNWVTYLDSEFWDSKMGGYHFAHRQTVKDLAVRPKPVHDNATPAGNGTMANVLCDLYHLTGETAYKVRFEELLVTFGCNDPNEIFGTPGLATALQRFENMEIIALIAAEHQSSDNALFTMACKSTSPNRKILLGDNSSTFGPLHPLHGKKAHDGQMTAYVCQVGQCSAPLTDAAAFDTYLKSLASD